LVLEDDFKQGLVNQVSSLPGADHYNVEEKIWEKLKLVDTFTEVEVKMEIILIKEKETPGTWRFKEDKNDRPMTIYLSKVQV
jgi:hypothetical protein